MVCYNYNDKLKVLIQEFTGDITVDAIIESWVELKVNGVLDDSLNGVISHYNGNVEIQYFELQKLNELMREQTEIISRLQLMIVINQPEIALGLIFKNRNNWSRMEFFPTVKMALKWFELCRVNTVGCFKMNPDEAGNTSYSFCSNCSLLKSIPKNYVEE